MFESLGEKFENVFRKVRGQKTLTEDNMKEAIREVRMALLEADVNYQVVREFVGKVREEALGQEVVKGVNPAQQLFSIVHNRLVEMIRGDEETDHPFEIQAGKENMVLMLGLQGSGKTTFCGKLATHLRDKKCKPLLVACDIYRPAAVDQLKQVGERIGVPVFEMGTDHPVTEIIDHARKHASQQRLDTLIIDTAGRLHIDEVRMDELVAVRKQFQPDYTFLVADAMTGQDAVHSAKAFDEGVGIDGVCLTKLDGDARGGAALSIKAVTGKPIVFVGVGEKPTDLEVFHADRVAQRILGMGDVASLVEKAQEAIDEEEAMALREKLGTGQFDFSDFLKQMKMIKRMGSLKGLLGMMPGLGSAFRNVDSDELTGELKRVEAMVLSMTPQEREEPELVIKQGKRRERIAKGSGHTLKQVNELVRQFDQMRGMMQQMSQGGMLGALKGMMGGGGLPAMPGAEGDPTGEVPMMPGMGPGEMPPMPGMPGYRRYKQQLKQMEKQRRGTGYQAKKKKKKKTKRNRR